MRKQTKVLLLASAIAISLAAAPSLSAQDSRNQGMMGRDGMMRGEGMMGDGGMMGSMMRMMDHCSQMMQQMPDGSQYPNDQWRKRPQDPKSD